MRVFLVLGLLLLPGAVVAQEPPEPTRSTEVFTGGGDAAQPRERPATPVTRYWQVQLFLKMADAPQGARAQVLLPLSDQHQQILGRQIVTMDGFAYREDPDPPNLWGHWTRSAAGTGAEIGYELSVATTDTVASIPPVALEDFTVPDSMRDFLQPSALVQSNDVDIRHRARDLVKDARTVEDAAWTLFQYTAAFVRVGPGEAKEDAVTVLKQERGSSAGKARLLTALLRSSGVPARVVGGLKLEDASKKRATISWVEAHLGGAWVPLDPGGGYFGWLPNQCLALYRGDLPLIVHTSGVPIEYGFVIHRTSREALAVRGAPTPGVPPEHAETQLGGERVRTTASYVERPVASVVVIADQSVPDAVSERMLHEAQSDEINMVILHARFESRYFREQYLQRLVSNNLALIRGANVLLIATRDDAGLYALMTLGEKEVPLGDMRIVIAGDFPRAVGRVLGAVLYRLVSAGEVVLVNQPTELLGLWEIVRANVINGVPMEEEAGKWEVKPLVVNSACTTTSAAGGIGW